MSELITIKNEHLTATISTLGAELQSLCGSFGICGRNVNVAAPFNGIDTGLGYQVDDFFNGLFSESNRGKTGFHSGSLQLLFYMIFSL